MPRTASAAAVARREFAPYARLLRAGGVWPLRCCGEPTRLLLWRRLLLLANSAATVLWLCYSAASSCAGRCTALLAFAISLAANLLIMAYLAVRRPAYMRLMLLLASLPDVADCTRAHRPFRIIVALTSLQILCWNVSCLYSGPDKLLLELWYPLEDTAWRRLRQAALLTSQTLVAVNHMSCALAFSALFVHFCLLAAAHLEAVKGQLRRPRCRLPPIVRHHQGVLRFLAEMEEVYHLVLVWTFLPMIVVLCLIIFTFVMKAMFDLTTVQMLMFFAIYFCNIAVICYFGSMITSQAESVRVSAYGSEWPVRELAFQRSVLLVMARAGRGIALTVGRCRTVSIRTFSAMLQESFSYLMVMLSIARRNAGLGEGSWTQPTAQGANCTVTHHG